MEAIFGDDSNWPNLMRLKSSSKSAVKGASVERLEDCEIYPKDYKDSSRYADEYLLESGKSGEFFLYYF